MPGRLSIMTMKPAPIMTGKPTPKMFSCGAARLITPKATLISSIAVNAVSAIISAPLNMRLPQPTSDQKSAHGALRIVDGIALSARERVVLVQVGDEQVLLGVAPGRVNAVHVLDEPVKTTVAASPLTDNFAARLRDVLGREKLT